MVTRDILYLAKDTFLHVVVKKNFPILSVGKYTFRVGVAINTYAEIVIKYTLYYWHW